MIEFGNSCEFRVASFVEQWKLFTNNKGAKLHKSNKCEDKRLIFFFPFRFDGHIVTKKENSLQLQETLYKMIRYYF